MCTNVSAMQKFLKIAGADPSALDNRQRSAKYYKDHISELELPSAHKTAFSSRRGTQVSDSEYFFDILFCYYVDFCKNVQNSYLQL